MNFSYSKILYALSITILLSCYSAARARSLLTMRSFEDDVRDSMRRFASFFDDDLSWVSRKYAADIIEQEHSIIVEVEVPGITIDSVDIEIEGRRLKISGEHEHTHEENEGTFYSKEIKRGHFERIVTLPSKVLIDQTEASMKNGMLRIVMQKDRSSESHKVRISVQEAP